MEAKVKHMYDDVIWKNDTIFEIIGSGNFGLFNMASKAMFCHYSA